jgi:hypothetical protein
MRFESTSEEKNANIVIMTRSEQEHELLLVAQSAWPNKRRRIIVSARMSTAKKEQQWRHACEIRRR